MPSARSACTVADGSTGGLDRPAYRSQAGLHLTSAQGLRRPDTDHSPETGIRGPGVLEDFHRPEKVTHLARGRMPQRVNHARGTTARGVESCARASRSQADDRAVTERSSIPEVSQD
jgi:catalase